MQPIKRITGTVTAVLEHKGYGFITATDGTKHFFLRKDLRGITQGSRPDLPPEGATVTYLVARIEGYNAKGKKKSDQAIDIEVL